MDEFLKYLPLLNVFVIPAGVAAWRMALEMQRLREFMTESKEDRAKLWSTVRPMEREMLKRGMLDAS